MVVFFNIFGVFTIKSTFTCFLTFLLSHFHYSKTCIESNIRGCAAPFRATIEAEFSVITTQLTIESTMLCPDPCVNGPCGMNGVCESIMAGQQYRCTCYRGWLGDHCERSKSA